jgi:enoyl-CoA hydratase
MEQPKFIDWEQRDAVATVWLNRPPVNAISQEMYSEIREFFGNLTDYLPDARVAVLAGKGPHFCAGNDLADFQTLNAETNAEERLRSAREAFWSIYDSPLPTIAAVHGVAVGAGLAIAASCDLVIAAEGSRFATPEVNVGVLGGAKHLSRLVPQGMVRLMHYTGDLIEVEKLQPFGGIAEIVPPEQLLDRAHQLAHSIARHSPVTLRLAKRSLNGIEYSDLKTGYEFEQSMTHELSAYDDSKEAVNAFVEKRAPVYTGR